MTNRRKLDHYPTETAVTRALLTRFGDEINGSVLEATAGAGQMARALAGPGRTIVTNDIDPAHECDFTSDAADPTAVCWEWPNSYEWVITNPPFSEAPDILPLAMCNARVGVAFLLRLSYMEPTQDRRRWLRLHADQMVYQGALNPRPRFRQGEINPKTGKPYGTDNVTVAWFVWKRTWSWERLGIRPPFDFVDDWKVEAPQTAVSQEAP